MMMLSLLSACAAILLQDQGNILHTFTKLTLSTEFTCEGATAGDLNRDGKKDVVAGPYWWEGPDYTKRHAYYPPKTFDPLHYSDNFFAYTPDLNGDGWNDVLIVGFPGKDASWYENPKGAEGHWQRHRIFDVVDNESPDYLDLTGDGKLELVAQHGGALGCASPDPSDPRKPWTFRPASPPSEKGCFTHGLGVGDVNGDGRADLLEKDGWWEQPATWSEDSPWKVHPFSFGNGGAQMFAFDADGDGDQDIVTSLAAHGHGLAWFEQVREGEGITFKKHLIMGKTKNENRYGVVFSELHALALADMDGDGVKDIVTGKRHWSHGPKGDPDRNPERNAPAVLYWFRTVRGAEAGAVDFVPYRIDDDSGVGTQLVVMDVNDDALPDVIVGNKKGTFIFLHQVRKVDVEEWRKAQPAPVVEDEGRGK